MVFNYAFCILRTFAATRSGGGLLAGAFAPIKRLLYLAAVIDTLTLAAPVGLIILPGFLFFPILLSDGNVAAEGFYTTPTRFL